MADRLTEIEAQAHANGERIGVLVANLLARVRDLETALREIAEPHYLPRSEDGALYAAEVEGIARAALAPAEERRDGRVRFTYDAMHGGSIDVQEGGFAYCGLTAYTDRAVNQGLSSLKQQAELDVLELARLHFGRPDSDGGWTELPPFRITIELLNVKAAA